jgi:hypothetical protein
LLKAGNRAVRLSRFMGNYTRNNTIAFFLAVTWSFLFRLTFLRSFLCCCRGTGMVDDACKTLTTLRNSGVRSFQADETTACLGACATSSSVPWSYSCSGRRTASERVGRGVSGLCWWPWLCRSGYLILGIFASRAQRSHEPEAATLLARLNPLPLLETMISLDSLRKLLDRLQHMVLLHQHHLRLLPVATGVA